VRDRSAWRWRRKSGCKLLNGWAPNPTRLLAYANQLPYPVHGFEPPPPSRPGFTKARESAGWCRSCPILRSTISVAGRLGRGSRFSPRRRGGLGALPRTPSQRPSRSARQRIRRSVPSASTTVPSWLMSSTQLVRHIREGRLGRAVFHDRLQGRCGQAGPALGLALGAFVGRGQAGTTASRRRTARRRRGRRRCCPLPRRLPASGAVRGRHRRACCPGR